MSVEDFVLISAILVIFALLGDFIITFILGYFQDNYSHVEDTMSELGNKESRFKTILSIWWFIWGLSLIIFSIGFISHAYMPFMGGYVVLTVAILIFIFGFGAGNVAGLFPEDPKGEEESVSGKIHGIFAGLGYLALLTIPSILATISGEWFLAISIVVQILGIVFFTLFLLSKNPKIGKSGLWQRLFLFNYYLYMIIIAVIMIVYP
jgi:MFS family permease